LTRHRWHPRIIHSPQELLTPHMFPSKHAISYRGVSGQCFHTESADQSRFARGIRVSRRITRFLHALEARHNARGLLGRRVPSRRRREAEETQLRHSGELHSDVTVACRVASLSLQGRLCFWASGCRALPSRPSTCPPERITALLLTSLMIPSLLCPPVVLVRIRLRVRRRPTPRPSSPRSRSLSLSCGCRVLVMLLR
jgi:hypothetical protein